MSVIAVRQDDRFAPVPGSAYEHELDDLMRELHDLRSHMEWVRVAAAARPPTYSKGLPLVSRHRNTGRHPGVEGRG